MNIPLNPELEEKLKELAVMLGEPAENVLKELVAKALSEAVFAAGNGAVNDSEQNCYEAAMASGFIGSAKGLPSDLSTSPKHMSDFGSD